MSAVAPASVEAYTVSPGLWAPQENGVRKTIDLLNKGRQPILYGPTGCGKTRMATELMLWAHHHGLNGAFYVNRNLLLGQTRDRFEASGLTVGVRSAIYADMLDLDAPVQLVSAQTEAKRVWENKTWPLHDAQLVVIDEGHLQRTQSMRKTIDEYARRGTMIVLLTATPVDMVGWANEIVISGSMQEYRDCKAIVMANCKGVEVPDLSKIKRSVTGEYVMDGRKRKMYQQHIAGNVIANWKRFNPYAAPAMGYAPGKPESIYMVDKFAAIGSRWAHVDATDAYFDGKRYKLTRQLWTEISEQYKDNRFHGIWSRFKCLDEETEVLTKRGWIKLHDYQETDEVFQTSIETGESTWEQAKLIVKRHTGVMYTIKNNAMDVRVTDDHELVVRSASGCKKWKAETATRVALRRGSFHVPVAVDWKEAPGVDLSDSALSLLGWFMTDGHLRKDTGGITISQSTVQDQSVHEHIKRAIEGCGLAYTTGTYDASFNGKKHEPFVQYRVSKKELDRIGLSKWLDKDLSLDLFACNRHQVEVILEAVNLGDGAKFKKATWNVKTMEIGKGNATFLSRLQALCVTHGIRCNVHFAKCSRLYATPGRDFAVIRGSTESGRVRLEREEVVDELVWCVSTRLGTIVTRRNGKVCVVNNCREGVDFPFTHHVILATPIGSLQSYIQTVGRGLRWSAETPDEVIVTDHGGNYLNHGSPNADRPWDVLAWQSQAVASNYHRERILDGKKPESIVCPKCLTERPSGIVCPKCKTHSAAYSRQVREEDGQLVTYDRRLVPKRKTVKKPDTQKLWNQLYFGYVGKKNKQSFSQMYNYFYHVHRYHPPRNLQYMPISTFDWASHVHTVARHDLR